VILNLESISGMPNFWSDRTMGRVMVEQIAKQLRISGLFHRADPIELVLVLRDHLTRDQLTDPA
jgi:hypothetical protein